MNWLAHALLSSPNVDERRGNVLADLVRRADRERMSAAFQRGIRLHQAIDAFTDYHPIVGRSRARLSGDYRHTTGIIIDIFYDHLLAQTWERYAAVALPTFTAEVYATLTVEPHDLPADAQLAVNALVREDWFGAYRTLAGITTTLRRVSRRLSKRIGRPFALEQSVPELMACYDELAADFAAFFPQLQTRVAEVLAAKESPSPRDYFLDHETPDEDFLTGLTG